MKMKRLPTAHPFQSRQDISAMLACSRKKRKSAALISLPFWVPPPTPLFTGEIKFKKFFFPFRSPSNNFWLCVYGLNCVYSLISFQQQILLPRLQFFFRNQIYRWKSGQETTATWLILGLNQFGLRWKEGDGYLVPSMTVTGKLCAGNFNRKNNNFFLHNPFVNDKILKNTLQ